MSSMVLVQPELIRWARHRVNFAEEDLAHAVGAKDAGIVREWEQSGSIKLSQLEKIARKTYTPLGYLFLPHPPADNLPIADFRTHSGAEPLTFVGSASVQNAPGVVAAAIRDALGGKEDRAGAPTWEEATRILVRQIEDSGAISRDRRHFAVCYRKARGC